MLKLVKQSPSAFFERLVVELLVNMGYGGSRRDAARAVGQVGDEGIDGIIDEDRLGLDTIYIQAKRCCCRPEIQKFVGALMGKRARKGIFITTSTFSAEAIDYVVNIDMKIVLIDGKRLAELIIDYDVGVATVSTCQLKRVDSDYFGNG
nr:restriction endonuclease [Chloroflexus sp.]